MKKALSIMVHCLLAIIISSRKLIYVQQVFRHGARNPEHPNQHDFSNITVLWNSQGQLTTQGKNMHYLLGQQIYKQYWGQLFTGTPFQNHYNQSKIYVKSTNYNRTIQSAQSHLMGMLENLPSLALQPDEFQFALPQWKGFMSGQKISANLKIQKPTQQWQIFGEKGSNFHSIPIHVEKIQSNLDDTGDFLLSYSQELCPKQKLWAEQNFKSQKAQQIKSVPQVKQAMAALTQALKLNETVPFQQVYWYIDNFYCLKYMQVKYLDVFANPKFKDTFHFIYAVGMYLQLFYTYIQRQISTSQFFDFTLQNMNEAINNTYQAKQLVVLSAHDTTVGAVIASLNMTNVDCLFDFWVNKNTALKDQGTCIVEYPIYTSNVIFQLWQNSDKNHTIRILYNGQIRKIPICNYSEQCSLEQFSEWVNQFRTDQFLRDCGIDDPIWNFGAIISIFLCVLIVAFGYICYQKKKMKLILDQTDINEQKQKGSYQVHVEQKQVQMKQQIQTH